MLPALIVLALAACSDPAADAERELAIIQKSRGSSDEICAASRKVADAYLKKQSEMEYRMAKSKADGACLDAQLERMR